MKATNGKKKYLHSIDLVRCFALLLLIAGHCTYSFEYKDSVIFQHQMVRNILVGNSILFVFLSGFLFEYLLHKGYQYQRFIINKCVTILVPYLIFTTPLIVRKLYPAAGAPDLCDSEERSICLDPLASEIFNLYLYGQAAMGHWFMPFILLVFLLTPLYLMFLKLSNSYRALAIFLFSLAAVFVHRPVGSAGFIQNLLYFSGVFLLGMFTSNNYKEILRYTKSVIIASVSLAFGFLLLQIILGESGGFKNKALFEYDGVDWLYFQKVFLCLFLVFLSPFILNRSNRFIKGLAGLSFGMILIHPYFMFATNKLLREWFDIYKPYPAGVAFLCYVILVFVCSALFILLCKGILRGYSKYITGY